MGTVLSTLDVVTLLSLTQSSEVGVVITMNPIYNGQQRYGVFSGILYLRQVESGKAGI